MISSNKQKYIRQTRTQTNSTSIITPTNLFIPQINNNTSVQQSIITTPQTTIQQNTTPSPIFISQNSSTITANEDFKKIIQILELNKNNKNYILMLHELSNQYIDTMKLIRAGKIPAIN